jgi:hypothetical protein
MLAVAAKREQDESLPSAVDQLAAHRRSDPHELPASEVMLGLLDPEGQLTLQHEIDLLLALVRVYAPALARLEDDEVHPEGADPEFPAQRLQALIGIGFKRCEGEIAVGHA